MCCRLSIEGNSRELTVLGVCSLFWRQKMWKISKFWLKFSQILENFFAPKLFFRAKILKKYSKKIFNTKSRPDSLKITKKTLKTSPTAHNSPYFHQLQLSPKSCPLIHRLQSQLPFKFSLKIVSTL